MSDRMPSLLNKIVSICASLITIFPILWGLQLAPNLGIALYKEQFLAVMLGLALCLIFITKPINRKRSIKPVWYDYFFSILGAATLLYLSYDYQRFQLDFPYQTKEMLLIGTIVFVLVMMALQRATGFVLFSIVCAFILYALVGHLIPDPLTGRHINLGNLLVYLGFDTNAALGVPLSVVTTIVILFIFFGQLLMKTGGGEFFIDLSMAIMGRRRGGAAKISVLASALFGSISGSAVSNVSTTGVMTIPLMQRSGYSPVQSSAIEAIASTGGQIVPPIMGAAAFLMAEFLEIPYSEVIVAALIPALFYYFAVFTQVDLVAARKSILVKQKDLPRIKQVLKEGWHFFVPFAVMLYALFILNAEAEIAALYAAVIIILGGGFRSYKSKKLNLKGFLSAFSDTGIIILDLIIIVTAAGFVIGILNITGGGFALSLFLIKLGGGYLIILLCIAAFVCIILGMGMPTSGVYVLLSALVAPSLIESGVEPLAAHMFILYFGMMSMITPPIALASFAAATISNSDPFKTGFESMKFGWVAYIVPFLFVVSPTLIMKGEMISIFFDVITVIVGIYFVSAAVVGYFLTQLKIGKRLLLSACGLATMLPQSLVGFMGAINYIAILIGLLIFGHLFLTRKSSNKIKQKVELC